MRYLKKHNTSFVVRRLSLVFSCALFLLITRTSDAARVGDLTKTDIWEQATRFFSFQDASLRFVLLGSILLGICCGLLGSYIVVRRMALLGDTLSHAVLPGVVAGFIYAQSKDPVAIFVGATCAGLLGTAFVNLIIRTTRIKQDAALGLVLASFFAVGICMMSMIQRQSYGNKSGLDKFLFGQAAAMGMADVQLIAIVTVCALCLIVLFYKELLIVSFDTEFSRSVGFPSQWIHNILMLWLAFAVVVALQAVGVVLVSAMLITPAAAAYLLADRLPPMLFLAALFGLLAASLGAFFSFLGNNLPTGPFMVLGASVIFLVAFLWGPRHGVITRWWRNTSRAQRTKRENTLKAIYHVLEQEQFHVDGVSLIRLSEKRQESLENAKHQAEALVKNQLATWGRDGESVYLTPSGWQKACEIVRNHRLWELYLTNEADIAADHVHEDAEVIEHVLGEDIVFRLEKQLSFPHFDPHGKPIPSLIDLQNIVADSSGVTHGYRGGRN